MARLRITELLEKRDTNLHKLEKQTGIAYTTLLRYRDGETAGVRFHHIDLLCKHLKCSVSQLIEVEKAE